MESSEPFIAESARKHGVPDEDILHALRNAVRRRGAEDDTTVEIGPDRAGNPLELAWIWASDGVQVIIHAMPARPKYRRG